MERDEHAIRTLEANFTGRVLGDDIVDVTVAEILRAGGLRKGDDFLLAAGPPCQLWSHARFWLEDMDEVAHDPGAATLEHFLRVLRGTRPRAFLFENVWGLSYKTHSRVFTKLRSEIESYGYRIWYKVINAAELGVPQFRKRLIMVGSRGRAHRVDFVFPARTHGTIRRPFRTAGDAIQMIAGRTDLAEENESVEGKWGHLLPLVPAGGNYLHFTAERGCADPLFKWRSKYWSFLLKLSVDLPAWTIAASPGPYTGPFHWDNRRLRVPELKLLQTFPMTYPLSGGIRDQRRQIGNAVPPRLGEVIGHAIAKQLF